MVGPILAVLMMGMLPVSGGVATESLLAGDLRVASPVVASLAKNAPPALSVRAHLSASGVVVMDLDSGQTILSKGGDKQRPMASLTKLMTALIIVENHGMDEWVTVPADISDPDSSLAHLPGGRKFRAGDVLKALLINSSNEAAVTLAKFHSGSVPKFVAAMNERAEELGLRHTSFANPTGLDAADHYASPRDIAWLATYVLRRKEIQSRMGTEKATIVSSTGDTIELTHTHQLLKAGAPIIAGKTGTTDDAKQCLLSIVKEGGHEYVVVILRSDDRYGDMLSIMAALHRFQR